MNTSERFYRERLYPLQDGILALVTGSRAPFYLTGGTALSRRWFAHRFSEDLDLFVDSDPEFARHADAVLAVLEEEQRSGHLAVDPARRRRSPWHVQLYVATTDCRVAVTGTVFSVSRGLAGSRVSVVEAAHVWSDCPAGVTAVTYAGRLVASMAIL